MWKHKGQMFKKKKKRKKKVPFCVFQSFPLGLEVFVDVKSDYHGVRSVRFTLSWLKGR